MIKKFVLRDNFKSLNPVNLLTDSNSNDRFNNEDKEIIIKLPAM